MLQGRSRLMPPLVPSRLHSCQLSPIFENDIAHKGGIFSQNSEASHKTSHFFRLKPLPPTNFEKNTPIPVLILKNPSWGFRKDRQTSFRAAKANWTLLTHTADY